MKQGGNLQLEKKTFSKVVLLVLIVGLVFIISACGKKQGVINHENETTRLNDQKYKEAMVLIKEAKWDSAKKLLEGISGYKNLKELETFVNAKLVINNKFGYEVAQMILEEIPKDYNGDLKDEISEFRNSIPEKIYLSGFDFIDKGEYENAQRLFKKLGSYKNSEAMYNIAWGFSNYQTWLESGKKDEYYSRATAIEFIRAKPENYGKYADQINKALREIGNETINFAKKAIADENDHTSSSPAPAPTVGMTEEELINSSWGIPEKINRTVTSYGVDEQWVYSQNRYVYLENGKVTAIQDTR